MNKHHDIIVQDPTMQSWPEETYDDRDEPVMLMDDQKMDKNDDFFNLAGAKNFLQKQGAGAKRILRSAGFEEGFIRLLKKRNTQFGRIRLI